MAKYAVVGGSGLQRIPELEVMARHAPSTPYGVMSDEIVEGTLERHTVYFLNRHGPDARLAPHQINYRANIWALSELGAEAVFAVNAVGSLDSGLEPGDLVVPDQLLDFTWGREHSFNLRPGGAIQHIDFTHPYDAGLRRAITSGLKTLDLALMDGGVYACTQGPRLETAMEVQRLRREGGDIVGMTGMPEAALARELGLKYAALCLVVNRGAGLDPEPPDLSEIYRVLDRGMTGVAQALGVILNKTNR